MATLLAGETAVVEVHLPVRLPILGHSPQHLLLVSTRFAFTPSVRFDIGYIVRLRSSFVERSLKILV